MEKSILSPLAHGLIIYAFFYDQYDGGAPLYNQDSDPTLPFQRYA